MTHSKHHVLPTGLYTVRMYAYCGMSYDVDSGLDRREAVRAIVHLARRRRRSGHVVTHTIGAGGLPEYEFGEPKDCGLIPDTAGTAAIVPETQPAAECFECGDLVRVGETCTCQDPIDDDEPIDDVAEDQP